MSNINLTVVTAIYNRIDGLMNVFKSLEEQTYKYPIEHILVDDCSTEIDYNGLVDLCKDNPHRHFVRLGFRSHFYGCFARTIGTLLSFSYLHHFKRDIDNEWVMYADTDNYFKPNHIQSVVDVLNENPTATLIASDAEWVGVNDKNWKETRTCKIRQGGCDLGQFAYRTSLFRKYGYWFAHPRRKQKYDFELISKMAEGEGDKLVYTHLPTFIMSYRKK